MILFLFVVAAVDVIAVVAVVVVAKKKYEIMNKNDKAKI